MELNWRAKINEGENEDEDELWTVFHENSKTSHYDPSPPNDAVIARVMALWGDLPYEGYERIPLPEDLAPLDGTVRSAILEQTAESALSAGPITLTELATLLHCAYGIVRYNEKGSFPGIFRSTPSAGAAYPLELYLHSSHVEGMTPGLYHFNSQERTLDLVLPGDSSRQISAALQQPELALNAGVLIFITAIFQRVICKYADRGYRFALIDAGHVAQNLNIAAAALGLRSVNAGSFIDREIDNLLGLDGMAHSTLYLTGIWKNARA